MNDAAMIIGYTVMLGAGTVAVVAAYWYAVEFVLRHLGLTKLVLQWAWEREKAKAHKAAH